MSSYVQEKKKGQSRALGCNARSDHHSEALALARYLMNRTKLAQQCGGLPDDLTIELISPSAKSYQINPSSLANTCRDPFGRSTGTPPSTAVRRTIPSIGLTAKRPPTEVLGKIEGPSRPLWENSGPIPNELLRNRPADCPAYRILAGAAR